MSEPGSVTFLFTDIEGSTRLWQEHAGAMREALEQHDRIVREALSRHRGHVFNTSGDGFCVAFDSAPAALAAALEAQLALTAATWAPLGRLRVRMALHTGAVDAHEGDYFGLALSRVARILSAAHGGQVLLSQAAVKAVDGRMPGETGVRDLGAHRLKDLAEPERIFQLLHPVLPDEFPPLRSLEAFSHNLPRQLTSFIGRERESRELRDLLDGTALVTLTGHGGSGKTRLALQIAADLVDEFEDGAWLVELAAVSEDGRVARTIAGAIGVREEPGRALNETVLEYLSHRSLLLLLDNCEHLVEESARVAESLLRACPRLKILATSREALGVPGETVYRLRTLALPPRSRQPDPAHLLHYEAVRLFVDRAAAHQPGFTLTPANAKGVAELCTRLDGLPLALELAAGRIRALPVEEINARLVDRFRLLTGGSRTVLPRQQTLRAVIDWSYDLLDDAEKVLLRRLGVFAGAFDLRAAEQICAGTAGENEAWLDYRDVAGALVRLVEKSLLTVEERDGATGYRLLDTLRQYASDRLSEVGEEVECRMRHRDWCLAAAEEARRYLDGPQQREWFARLDCCHDDLRTALQWTLHRCEAADAVRFVAALWRFWLMRCYWSEGRERLEDALRLASASGSVPAGARAEALFGAFAIAQMQGDYAAVQTYGEESLAIRRRLNDPAETGRVLTTLGLAAFHLGEYAEARRRYVEALALAEEAGDTAGEARVRFHLGTLDLHQGSYAAAEQLLRRALAVGAEIGSRAIEAAAVNALGDAASAQGRVSEARTCYERSLLLAGELGNRAWEAEALMNLGDLAFSEGETAAARTLFEQSLMLRRQIGGRRDLASSLLRLGRVAFADGDLTASTALTEEALAHARAAEHKPGIASALHLLGELSVRQGDSARARSLFREALSLRHDLGSRPEALESLAALARLLEKEGEVLLAAQLWGAVEVAWESADLRPLGGRAAALKGSLDAARAAVAREPSEIAWDEGRQQSFDAAVARALGNAA